jgi:hypothetical protein
MSFIDPKISMSARRDRSGTTGSLERLSGLTEDLMNQAIPKTNANLDRILADRTAPGVTPADVMRAFGTPIKSEEG